MAELHEMQTAVDLGQIGTSAVSRGARPRRATVTWWPSTRREAATSAANPAPAHDQGPLGLCGKSPDEVGVFEAAQGHDAGKLAARHGEGSWRGARCEQQAVEPHCRSVGKLEPGYVKA